MRKLTASTAVHSMEAATSLKQASKKIEEVAPPSAPACVLVTRSCDCDRAAA